MKDPVETARDIDQRKIRRSRIRDAALILPAAGLVLFVQPLIEFGVPAGETIATRSAGIYFFVAWFLLIGLAAILSRKISRNSRARD